MDSARLRGMARKGAFLALLVLTPAVALLLLTREQQSVVQQGQISAYVAYALVLGAGVFVYFDWRMCAANIDTEDRARLTGWLTVGLVVVAIQGLVVAVSVSRGISTGPIWPLLDQLALLVVLSVIGLLANHREVRVDPIVVGVGISLVLTSAYAVARTAMPIGTWPAWGVGALIAAVMAWALVVVIQLFHHPLVPFWMRKHLAVPVLLLATAPCLGALAGKHVTATGVIVALNLGGALILGIATQSLLRRSLSGYQEQLVALQASLTAARADFREDEELLHEVGSTLAGIATASRMISEGTRIEPVRRERLEAMVTAEVGRLVRLMSERADVAAPYDGPELVRDEPSDFAVDDVVEPLVISHQARGRDVRWQPCDLRANGNGDDLAEVVNILLENAARHGRGPIELDVRSDGEFVELVCSDHGPGVPADLRERIFESGVRHPDSPGHGFGLAIAKRLMVDVGGSLELADLPHHGATFVARTRRSEVDRVGTCYVA